MQRSSYFFKKLVHNFLKVDDFEQTEDYYDFQKFMKLMTLLEMEIQV